MKLKPYLFISTAACLLFSGSIAFAGIGDTTQVTTHNQVIMVTNPGTGSNPYPAWGVFPSASTQYRKVILHLNYKCPPGMACGEWDYIDWVYLRRIGGVRDRLNLYTINGPNDLSGSMGISDYGGGPGGGMAPGMAYDGYLTGPAQTIRSSIAGTRFRARADRCCGPRRG